MAEENLEQAATIYAELCAMEHLTQEEMARSLFGLGTCNYVTGRPDTAAPLLQRAWEILYASAGMQHPLTAKVMVMLSRALFALGNMQTGMEVGRSALQILEGLYGKHHEQTATAAFFLASGAIDANRLAESEDLVCQAMESWGLLHGKDSLQVAMCLDALGVLRDLCGENREGTDFHTQALEIKLARLGEIAETAQACGAIGMAEAKLKNWPAACERLTQALRILKGCDQEEVDKDIAAFSKCLEMCRSNMAQGE